LIVEQAFGRADVLAVIESNDALAVKTEAR
jgi:hypothetical protein